MHHLSRREAPLAGSVKAVDMPARRSDYFLLNQVRDFPYHSLDNCLPEETPPAEERVERNLARNAVVLSGPAEQNSYVPVGTVPFSYLDRSTQAQGGIERGHDWAVNHPERFYSAPHERALNSSYTEWDSCLAADRFAYSAARDRDLSVVPSEQLTHQSLDQNIAKTGFWPVIDRSSVGEGSIGAYGSSLLQRQSSGSSFTDSLLSSDVPLSTLSPTVSISASDSALFSAYYEDACKQDLNKGIRPYDGSSQSWAQQIVQSYNLQLSLALRLVATAQLTEEPLLNCQARESWVGSCSAASTSVEATALRFWVNGSLGYNDKITDGFYFILGMNPYVWAICSDGDERGRMPSLESLWAVDPADTSMVVILFDKHGDVNLRELENEAISIAYEATDSKELAELLGKLVCNLLGGAASSEQGELMDRWKANSRTLKDCLNCVVLPMGSLSLGLCRHRALLYKALADSVELPCRVIRGCKYCGLDDGASCLVLCGTEREFLVDLIAKPGVLCNPESFLRSLPPMPVSSPLRLPELKPLDLSGEAGSQGRGYTSKCKLVEKTQGPVATEPGLKEYIRISSRKAGADLLDKVSASAEMASICHGKDGTLISRSPDSPDGERPTVEGRRLADNLVSSPMHLKMGLTEVVKPSGRHDISKPERDSIQNSIMSSVPCKVDGDISPQQLTSQAQKQLGLGASVNASSKLMDRIEEQISELNEEQGGTSVKSKTFELSLALEGLEIVWEDLTLRERIGAGSFGTVHRADWQGSDVAVKILIEQDLHEERLKEFVREVAIMKRLRHPNVVLFMGAVTKPPNLSIVTEYLQRGSLFRLLHRPGMREILDERRRIRMALDVARGLNYLHRLNPPLVHRDLKSPNLLVDKTWTVKVCDFGLSRLKANTFLSSRSAAGTPEWMAPEVLRDEPSNEKSDVFSFGVILWELVTLQQPWSGLSPAQVVGAVGFQNRRLQVPKDVNPEIAGIIESCWASDPRQRSSFASIMESLKLLQKSPVTQSGGNVGN